MSINWVMLSETEGFVRLPGERILYASPPRTTLSLTTPNTYPGAQGLSISSGGGVAYLTNQRIVYLPATPTPELTSFSSPILNLHDTHVSAPFFGPNVWSAALQPVPGGGIPTTHTLVTLKMVFKEGGAFDFHTQFERIKERLHQALEVARESGQSGPVDISAINLEQLPAYEEASGPGTRQGGNNSSAAAATADGYYAPRPVRGSASSTGGSAEGGSWSGERKNSTPPPPAAAGPTERSEERLPPPMEPPPGYEEAQAQSISEELDRQLMRGSR